MMKVLNEWETIDWIIQNRGSIGRYGDGELKLCLGRNAKSQQVNVELCQTLRSILQTPLDGFIAGIPRIYSGERMPTEQKQKFWNRYTAAIYVNLFLPTVQYGSAFITRPDTNLELLSVRYFSQVKKIWEDRRVVLLQGEGAGFLKGKPCIFETAAAYSVIEGPKINGWAYRAVLREKLLQMTGPEDVIVLSFGPTATVLAFDLCVAGRQAVDLGHLGQFYAHCHPKSGLLSKDWGQGG